MRGRPTPTLRPEESEWNDDHAAVVKVSTGNDRVSYEAIVPGYSSFGRHNMPMPTYQSIYCLIYYIDLYQSIHCILYLCYIVMPLSSFLFFLFSNNIILFLEIYRTSNGEPQPPRPSAF